MGILSAVTLRVETGGLDGRGTKLYLLHGGPGAQGSLHGLCQMLPAELLPREILQRRYDPKSAADEESPVMLTVEQHVLDLAAIEQEPANILGHSWGAMLALSFAARFPNRCRQLILVGCGTYSQKSRAEYEYRMSTLIDPLVKNEFKRLIAEAEDEVQREMAFKAYGAYVTKLQSFDQLTDDLADRYATFDPIGHQETWEDVLRLQAQGVEPERFQSITCPVTLIQGADDPHPGRLIAEDLLPYVPQLNYVELQQCGHEPWLEAHAQSRFLELVTSLCRG